MESYAFNIGQAADASGVSAKMIRHYEDIGLIPKVRRTESGYRQYSGNEVHELRFIRQGRHLGFSTRQIDKLLKLWRDQRRPSHRVKQLALEHMRDLDRKIEELRAMKTALSHLVKHCHGDARPDCPILDGLASHGPAAHGAHGHDRTAAVRRPAAGRRKSWR